MANVSIGFSTKISLNDSISPGESYVITQTFPPAEFPPSYSSFNGKFINITPISGIISIDKIDWNWNEFELGSTNESTLELWKYNGAWSNTGAVRDTNANTLSLTKFDPASLYAVLNPTQAQVVSACAQIFAPGEYVLDTNVSGAPNFEGGFPVSFSCIKISAPDVTFDCKGFSITNDNISDAAGIFVAFNSNAKVQNCRVSGYRYGALSFQDFNVKFANNTLTKNNQGTAILNSPGNILENEHYYNNSERDVDIKVDPGLPDSINFNIFKSIFDNPAGNSENFSTISINDAVFPGEEISIKWFGRPFPSEIPPLPPSRFSFRDKFILIETSPDGIPVDNITWYWTDAASSGFDENSFELWKISATNLVWANAQANRNTAANTLSLTNGQPGNSLYAITHSGGAPPQPPSGGQCGILHLVNFTPDCEENVLTIYIDSRPFVGANVTIERTEKNGTKIANGFTDGQGKFRFKAIGGDIFVLVDKNTTKTGECFEIPGTGKFITTLKSAALCAEENPVCDRNSDCNQGLVCLNKTCVTPTGLPPPPPPPVAVKCLKNSDCPPSDFCRSGSCVAVSGTCGFVSNHTWFSYDCCDNLDCPSGQVCSNSKCALSNYRLVGEVRGFVGDMKLISAYSDSRPFVDAQLKVSRPDGSFYILTTDSTGKSIVQLTQAGNYTIELIVNSKLVSTAGISSIQRELPPVIPRTSDLLSSPLTLTIILLIIAVVGFMVFRYLMGAKKPEKKRKR